MRPYRSRRNRPCDACRWRKGHCVINDPRHRCAYCAERDLDCTFIERPQKRLRGLSETQDTVHLTTQCKQRSLPNQTLGHDSIQMAAVGHAVQESISPTMDIWSHSNLGDSDLSHSDSTRKLAVSEMSASREPRESISLSSRDEFVELEGAGDIMQASMPPNLDIWSHINAAQSSQPKQVVPSDISHFTPGFIRQYDFATVPAEILDSVNSMPVSSQADFDELKAAGHSTPVTMQPLLDIWSHINVSQSYQSNEIGDSDVSYVDPAIARQYMLAAAPPEGSVSAKLMVLESSGEFDELTSLAARSGFSAQLFGLSGESDPYLLRTFRYDPFDEFQFVNLTFRQMVKTPVPTSFVMVPHEFGMQAAQAVSPIENPQMRLDTIIGPFGPQLVKL